MTIPDYQTIMKPLLKFSEDGKEHSFREAVDILADEFKLTDLERRELLPTGKQPLFDSRVSWAATYLRKAVLIKRTSRAHFCITDRGIDLLKQNPDRIDKILLSKYQEFKEFISFKGEKKEIVADKGVDERGTPREELYNAYQTINNELSKEVLQQLKNVSPERFENIVIELLVKMGYGGSFQDAIHAVGGPGDEGIDGVINQDRLGLDRVYIQAKRWKDQPVGHPEIRNFIGSLDIKHADRGVFITTSNFTNDAKASIAFSSRRIILIDGDQLAGLMISYGIGVTIEDVYEVKKIDMDYFVEE